MIYTPPGEEHWHGAAPDSFMIHIAVYEGTADGDGANWLEHVADEQYQAATTAIETRLGTAVIRAAVIYAPCDLHGGPAPVRRFLPELIRLTEDRAIDPGTDQPGSVSRRGRTARVCHMQMARCSARRCRIRPGHRTGCSGGSLLSRP